MSRFHQLVHALSENVQADYRIAQQYARDRDPQRAGHDSEATWAGLLQRWGPGWPVVTRKYVVGPYGESNEVDIVMVRPDYPTQLLSESAILSSGVAAAFSSRLTLRPKDIAEAIDQKARLMAITSRNVITNHELHNSPFLYGVLAHSAAFGRGPRTAGFVDEVQRHYERCAHLSPTSPVKEPAYELDCLLVADAAFFSTTRMWNVYLDQPEGYSVGSTLMAHEGADAVGAPIAQFVTWLHRQGFAAHRSALADLATMFGDQQGSGRTKWWPADLHPEVVLQTLSDAGMPGVSGH